MGERKKEKKKAVFRRSELVRPRSKVCIFDKAALQEVGILPTLVFFYPLSYCFGLLLGPRCAMFMACFVVLIGIWPILWFQLRRGCSRSKGLLSERIWVEKFCIWELPKCSCNPWAHYCVDWRNSVAYVVIQLRTAISCSPKL